MKGLFNLGSSKKAKEETSQIVTEKELLLTNGKGINTWYVNFSGKTEENKPVCFSYRLNITAVPLGLRPVRMYDSLLTVTYGNEWYRYERDYAMIKNKQHVPLDYLFFMANLSKIEGNFNLIELYTLMTNYESDVRLTYGDKVVKQGFLGSVDTQGKSQDMLAAGMDCEGRMRIDDAEHTVNGQAWVEKRFIAASEKGDNDSLCKTKLWLFNGNGAPFIAIESCYDKKTKIEKASAVAIFSDGNSKCYEVESILGNSTEMWKSSTTGKSYPFPLVVRIPELEVDIKVEPSIYEQEMIAEDGVYSEYVGSGSYTGFYGAKNISGSCGMEIIGTF